MKMKAKSKKTEVNILKNKYISKSILEHKIPVIPSVENGTGLAPPSDMLKKINKNTKHRKELVELKNIIGTVYKAEEIDEVFRPKRKFVNKKFRKVWKWIQANQKNDENIILPTEIILIKSKDNDYFVVDGLRRVVSLKYSNIVFITANVIDNCE